MDAKPHGNKLFGQVIRPVCAIIYTWKQNAKYFKLILVESLEQNETSQE